MATASEKRVAYINLLPGDPAPRFQQRYARNPNYAFDTAAGRYLVLCFFSSATEPKGRAQAADYVGSNFQGRSIISSARPSSECGTARPSIRAVGWLRANSNFVTYTTKRQFAITQSVVWKCGDDDRRQLTASALRRS